MKKTIIALAVAALAAGTANATVVYNNEETGSKIDIDGSIRMELQRHTDQRGDLVDRGSRVRFRGFQEIGNGFTALANMEIRFTKGGKDIGDEIHTKRLFGGLIHKDIGQLTFGKQLTNGDAVGVADFTYEYNPVYVIEDAGDKVISFISNSFNGFRFGADYIFGNSSKDEQEKSNDGYVAALFYDNKFGDLRINAEAGYSVMNRVILATTTPEEQYKEKAFRGGIAAYYKDFALGTDYYRTKVDQGKITKRWRAGLDVEKAQEFAVTAKYQIFEPTKIYAGYTWGKGEVDGASDLKMSRVTAGVDYVFNKNFLVYLEGQRLIVKQDGNEVKRDNQIHLGTRIMF